MKTRGPSNLFYRMSVLATLGAVSIFMAGCALTPVSSGTIEGDQVGGRAMGGETPITGSTITLYAAATTATGVANGVYTGTATQLATTTTDSSGDFSFGASSYTCPANTVLYVTAYGGNSGGGANDNILEIAVLGPCANVPPFVDIDEVTTAAAAYTFSSFMSVDTSGATPVVNIVASAANSSFASSNDVSAGAVTTASGLLHAYANFSNLVNTGSGAAYAAPPTNSAAIAPQAELNTIADMLQACVNTTNGSGGAPSANCGTLFSNATGTYATPTNTLQAALNLARNPYPGATQMTNLFGLVSGSPAFAPALSAAPKDWTLAIAYPVPPNPVSGVGFPFTLALDADDNVYVSSPENDPWMPTASSKTTTNSTSACLFGWTSDGMLRATITPYSGTPGTPGTPGTGTPGTSSWFCAGSQAATPQTTYLLTNIAPDNVGNIWVSNYANYDSGTPSSSMDGIVKLTNSGAYTAFYLPPIQTGASESFADVGLAVDKYNDVFFNELTSTSSVPNIVAFAAGAGNTGSTGTALTIGSTSTGPTCAQACRGLAFDANQNLLGASYGASSGDLGSLSLGGTALFLPITSNPGVTPVTYGTVFKVALDSASTSSNTGNPGPWGVAADSAGDAWVTTAGADGANGALDQTVTLGAIGLFEVTPKTATPYTAGTDALNLTTGFTSPKSDEVDGNGVVWVMDETGVIAYSSGSSAFLSETGGFNPCITTGTSCTYPDDTFAKGIAVDSTGAVWWTTPDTTTTDTNANMLIQMFGPATATWPLLATGKPGTMPQ